MGRIGEQLDIDFVISTGDNFYEDGLKSVSDPLFKDSFSKVYTAQSLQKPWYSSKSNWFNLTLIINMYYYNFYHWEF